MTDPDTPVTVFVRNAADEPITLSARDSNFIPLEFAPIMVGNFPAARIRDVPRE